MKKIFAVLLLCAAVTANAQSLQLKYDGQNINNNDTVVVSIDPAKTTCNVYVEYTNVSSQDVYFKVKQETVTMVDGALATFCIGGSCYQGGQSQEQTILAGASVTVEDETNIFHASYTASQPGVSIVKYQFFNTEAENDQVTFYVVYDEPLGISSASAATVALRCYPNPAVGNVTIEYRAERPDMYLVVKNLTGALVYKQKVEGTGKLMVSLADINAGVYLYGLECGGRMLQTRKLVVK